MVFQKNSQLPSSARSWLWVLAGLAVAVGALWLVFANSPISSLLSSRMTNDHESTSNENANNQNTKGDTTTNNTTTISVQQKLPTSKLLSVPFTPQAPTANWDELHNEACEEASSIMAHAYFSNQTSDLLDPNYVEQEITKLTNWQQTNLGYYLDATTQETARMIKEVYSLSAKVIPFPSQTDIKQYLHEGKLVIMSANGRKLGNPNFKQPGPIHHMLVMVGYNDKEILTNDPGTKRGQSYPYSYVTLKEASADWDHALGTVDNGIKLAIIVSK